MSAIQAAWVLSVLVGFSSNPSISYADTTGSAVHQTLTLTAKEDGIDASLEVLRDSRLTDADIKGMQAPDPETAPENATRFKAIPLRSATIRLKLHDGLVIQSLVLEKPLAQLEAVEIAKGKRAILLTQDFGIGMGSYNGPITRLLSIAPHSMKWVRARDSSTGKSGEISLMRSLKTAWNFSRDKVGNDILEVSCRPDESMDKFRTTYSRYHFDGRGWTLSRRTENVMWEAEDGDERLGYALPNLGKFPRSKNSS